MIVAALWLTLGFISQPEPTTSLVSILRQVPVEGLLVFDVIPGSQADRADLRIGDIITHYDGQPVTRHHELTQLARTASIDKKSEILLILRRGSEDLERTLPAGPIGVRLEDVSPAETRILTEPSAEPVPTPSPESFLAHCRIGTHCWYRVEAPTAASDSTPKGIGWSHHYLTLVGEQIPILRIQQQLIMNERTISQQIELALDPYHLEPTALRVISDGKVVLEANRDQEKWTGRRMGIPVETTVETGTLASYVAPYFAGVLAAEGRTIWAGRYLPAASLESAPLCQINRSAETAPFVLRVMGRQEMTVRLAGNHLPAVIELRGGSRLVQSSSTEITQLYPDAPSAFAPIDARPEPIRAN